LKEILRIQTEMELNDVDLADVEAATYFCRNSLDLVLAGKYDIRIAADEIA
jgi:hypothetical protein